MKTTSDLNRLDLRITPGLGFKLMAVCGDYYQDTENQSVNCYVQTKVNDAVDCHAEDPSERAQAGGAAKCIARTRAVTSLSEKRDDKP